MSWEHLAVSGSWQMPVCNRAFANLHPPGGMRKIDETQSGGMSLAFDRPHGLKGGTGRKGPVSPFAASVSSSLSFSGRLRRCNRSNLHGRGKDAVQQA